MKEKVIVYIRNDSTDCKRLLNKLDAWDISYSIKDVAVNHEHMKQLQENGIFATPATFIGERVILGFQENKLADMLGTANNTSHYGTNL